MLNLVWMPAAEAQRNRSAVRGLRRAAHHLARDVVVESADLASGVSVGMANLLETVGEAGCGGRRMVVARTDNGVVVAVSRWTIR